MRFVHDMHNVADFYCQSEKYARLDSSSPLSSSISSLFISWLMNKTSARTQARFPETRTPLWACFACRVPSTFGNEGAAISVCHKKRLACLVFAIGEYFISSFATRYIVKHLPSVFRNFDVYLNASGDHAQEH